MPPRLAAVCGLLAGVTYVAALFFGGLAQPDAFSSADDAISDLGSDTASSGWIYNQIGLNLTGILVVVLALGLWRELSPDVLARLGAVALSLTGFTLFLQGFFRLDCQAIDEGCENTSWRSEAHSWATGVSTAFLFAAPLLLAFAFRRLPRWRNTWLPTLAAVPLFIAMSIVFSAFGTGASTRAGAVAWFVWLAFVAFQLLRKRQTSRVTPAPA
jgi:hypothetical membrane protein